MNKLEKKLQSEEEKICRFCFNSTVCDDLTPDNDLSYLSVGSVYKGYSSHIRSGARRPTALLVSKYDESVGRNVDVFIYNMKYCPECGRKLIENSRLFIR